MTVCKLYENKVILISSVVFVLGCISGRASVTDLRKAICDETSLIHHFSFESPQEDSNTQRREDKVGTSRLSETIDGSTAPLYVQGMDSLSRGGSPMFVAGTFGNGSAWRTTNAIALPSTMTVECLFNPELVPDHETYVLGTRDGSNERGYYIRQNTDGKLETRVGAGAYRPIVSNFETGHWYYVVSTYSVNAGKTTINSYYADLTAGDDLQHPIVDEVENGTYGSSAFLGVGCLSLGDSQYYAPCIIDEVAIYNTVLDEDAISSHLKELKYAVPTVEYREIFPNDAATGVRYLPREGWKSHRGTNATHITTGPLIEEYNTAFDEDVEAIASFPQDTGVTQGYLNNHSGPTDTNYLYWTEEMTNNIDVSWLKLVKFDARFQATRDVSFTLRIDTNSTPVNTADDIWFYGLDFDHAPGTSLLSIPVSGSWHSHWFELGAGEWAVLDFEADSHLTPGTTEVSLPTNGLVTAFGLFETYHAHTKNERFDNLSLYVRRIYPPPPPEGTIILIK